MTFRVRRSLYTSVVVPVCRTPAGRRGLTAQAQQRMMWLPPGRPASRLPRRCQVLAGRGATDCSQIAGRRTGHGATGVSSAPGLVAGLIGSGVPADPAAAEPYAPCVCPGWQARNHLG